MLVQVQKIGEALDKSGPLNALRLAAKQSKAVLGEYRDDIQRGWAAHQNPGFYESLGNDPQSLISIGIAAVRRLLGRDA